MQERQTNFRQQGTSTSVITHGDAHHYNIIQTKDNLWLVDWDGVKIAPKERDLWHYEGVSLFMEYQKIDPTYKINHELCHWYRLQRFLEDCRYYLERVLLNKNSTEAQNEQDVDSFLTHWGWQVCI